MPVFANKYSAYRETTLNTVSLSSTAAILPKATYQRFVTLLPEATVASSLRSLFPHVTPALDLSAKVEIKSISQNSIAQEVSLILQGVGYREVRVQDNEVR